MSSYLVKVRKKMSIYAQRRARGVFAGNYGSVFKGRSMDFDDLREYNYGDDVKDIDWNATARSRNIMVRRYIAIRKHNILIVADNSNAMAALAPSGETKADVAAFCQHECRINLHFKSISRAHVPDRNHRFEFSAQD